MMRLWIQQAQAADLSELTMGWDGPVPQDVVMPCNVCVLMFVSLVEALEPVPALDDGPVALPPAADGLSWSKVRRPSNVRWWGVLKSLLGNLSTPPYRIAVSSADGAGWFEWAAPRSDPPLEQLGIVDHREGDAVSLEIEFGGDLTGAQERALLDTIDVWLSVGALGGFADDDDPVPSQLLPDGDVQIDGDVCSLALAVAAVDDLAFEALVRMVRQLGGPFAAAALRIE